MNEAGGVSWINASLRENSSDSGNQNFGIHWISGWVPQTGTRPILELIQLLSFSHATRTLLYIQKCLNCLILLGS
jgi:hypothetical protein